MNKTLIELTEYIKSFFAEDKGVSENDTTISVLKHLKEVNLPEKHNSKESLFRRRTAEQILKDGFTTGCTDDAVLFILATKACGLKPIYIEAIEKNWLESSMEERMIRGHAFVRINNLLIDPQRKIIYLDPDWILKRYVIYGEGNEPYDFGLTDFETSMKKFMEFKEKYQQQR